MLSNDDKGKLVKLLKELVSAGVTDDKTLNDKLVFIEKKIEIAGFCEKYQPKKLVIYLRE